jgi:ribosomal protein L37AE/L43A
MSKKVSPHFSVKEMSCPCCNVMGMDDDVIQTIEAVRVEYGKPIRLTSSFRCEKYNEATGAKPTSSHNFQCPACKQEVVLADNKLQTVIFICQHCGYRQEVEHMYCAHPAPYYFISGTTFCLPEILGKN